jgi:hypothetical protein
MKATWAAPTSYTDGRPFGKPDLAGFELQINDEPAVSVPFAWSDDGIYHFELGELGLEEGTRYSARVLTVATNGRKSDWSEGAEFTFARTPRAPFGLFVA